MQMNASALFQELGLYQQLTFDRPQRLITTLDIQISETETLALNVRENDDPYQLALSFCVRNKLNEIAVDVVQKRILKILGKDNSRRGGKSTSKGKIINRNLGGQTTIRNNKNRKSSASITEIKPSPLYQKGMRAMCRAKDARIKFQMQKNAEQERELTFKPQINEVSQKIVEVRKMMGGNQKKIRQQKIHELKDEMAECTFKPNINKESQKIVEEKFIRNQEENIQRLYNDSDFRKKRESRLNEIKQRFSYRPVINQKSKIQVRDTFMERLEKDIRNKKEKQLKNISENQGYSFTPEIGRPPKIERNKENLPIGQYLMNSQTKSKAHLRSKSEIKEQATMVGFGEVGLFGKNSGVIYNNLIKQRIESLFQTLDGNCDGLISPEHIDIEVLSTNTLLLMQPLFKEMEDMNAVLDERGFTKAMMKLLEVAPQHLKGEFIAERWKKVEDNKFSFKPTLNTKSHRLAQNRSALDLYEQGIKSRKKKQVYTAILQAKKEEEELDNCTFKPLLNSVSHVYFKKYLMREENVNHTSSRFIGSSRNEQI